ncbi:MAG: hypothetical protein U1F48_13150 [Burkholderiales bacterium]
MSIQAIHRTASAVAAASTPVARTRESYGTVAARVAQAGITAAPATSSPSAAGSLDGGQAFVKPVPSANAPVPPRPPGIPSDYVYRAQMWLPPAAAAIYDAQVADAAAQAAQVAFWHTSTNPAQIEGLPLEQWSTEQLQAGLAFYGAQRAQAVPQSNQWLALSDRINSIQANLDGNRSPWNWTLSQSVDYWSPIGSR